MEPWLHQRLEDHLHDRLRHAVGHCRNAQWARAAITLRYLDEPHRRRKIRPRRHPIPDLVEVALRDPSRTPPASRRPRPQRLGSPSPACRLPRRVASECRTALPQPPAPPLAGWPRTSAGQSGPFAPPALPGFIATTSRPPLCPASVLCSSRFGHLDFSLCIAAQVLTFRTRAWSELRAAFMPDAARAVSRHPPSCPGRMAASVLTSSNRFRHVISGWTERLRRRRRSRSGLRAGVSGRCRDRGPGV